MPIESVGTDARDVATLVLPGAVGVGLGVFLGTVLSESLVLPLTLAVLGAVAGHVFGYLLVRRRSERFD